MKVKFNIFQCGTSPSFLKAKLNISEFEQLRLTLYSKEITEKSTTYSLYIKLTKKHKIKLITYKKGSFFSKKPLCKSMLKVKSQTVYPKSIELQK